MNSERHNESSLGPISPVEQTLRLIANLPVPEGLVDRVHEKLRSTPRRTRVLEWLLWLGPGAFTYSAVMRGAAAAAIVFVVAGGGWGIYSRVQPLQPGPVIATPARIGGSGFSSAGAMRKPDSPKGAVMTHAIQATPAPMTSASQATHPKTTPKHAKKHIKAVPVIAQPQ